MQELDSTRRMSRDQANLPIAPETATEGWSTYWKTFLERRLWIPLVPISLLFTIWAVCDLLPAPFIENQARKLYGSGHHTLAKTVFRWECSGLHAEACLWLQIESETLLQTKSPNLEHAAESSGKACHSGESKSCLVVGTLYKYGVGVPVDVAQALILFSNACDAGYADGCADLGVMYVDESGISQDHSRATALFLRACDGGSAKGCNGIGNIYAEREDYLRAKVLYSQACDSGYGNGCANLGRIYKDGDGVAQNYSRAVALFSKACDSGSADGCNLLGVAYDSGDGIKQDSSRAKALYSQACQGGSEDGCSNLDDRLDREHADDDNHGIG